MKSLIRETAQQFRTRLCRELVFDFNRIIDQLNDVKLIYKEETFEDGYTIKFNNEYFIYINKNLSYDESKFLIAKELGHICLNHINNYYISYKRGSNQLHNDAEQFALELLLPAFEFKQIVLKNTNYDWFIDITEISKFFQLNESIILRRCQELKLIN